MSDAAIYRLWPSQDPELVLGVGSSELGGGPAGLPGRMPDVSRLRQLYSQQGQLRVQVAAETTKYGPMNPIVVALRSQIEELNKQVQQEIQRIGVEAKRNLQIAQSSEHALAASVDAEKQRIQHISNSADQ